MKDRYVFLKGILLGIILTLILVFLIQVATDKASKETQLSVPKATGIYIPIDNSVYGIVVLNMSDNFDKQLIGEIQRVYIQKK